MEGREAIEMAEEAMEAPRASESSTSSCQLHPPPSPSHHHYHQARAANPSSVHIPPDGKSDAGVYIQCTHLPGRVM